jgi:hypothetical protein
LPAQAQLDVSLDGLMLLGRERRELDTEQVVSNGLAVVPNGAPGLERCGAAERHDQLHLAVDVAAHKTMLHEDAQPAYADVARVQHVQKTLTHDVDTHRRRWVGVNAQVYAGFSAAGHIVNVA